MSTERGKEERKQNLVLKMTVAIGWVMMMAIMTMLKPKVMMMAIMSHVEGDDDGGDDIDFHGHDNLDKVTMIEQN